MIVHELEWQNFLSYIETTILNFQKLVGLLLLTGENRDSEGATSNGSGKSGVPEALYYCLTGKTLRGISHDDVINRTTGDNCLVRGVFEADREEYEIIRTRKHSTLGTALSFTRKQGKKDESLTADSMPETQKVIDKTFGFDHEILPVTAIFGQGASSFVEFKDSARKGLLTKILGYDFLDDLLEETKSRIKEVKESIEAFTVRIETYREQLRELETEDFSEKIQQFEAERQAALDCLEDAMKGLAEKFEEKVEFLEGREKEAESTIEASKEELKDKQGGIAEAQKDIGDLSEAQEIVQQIVKEIASFDVEETTLLKEADGIESLGEGVCHVCYQPLSKEVLTVRVEEIVKRLTELAEKKKSYTQLLTDANEMVDKGREAKSKFEVLKSEIKALERTISRDTEAFVGIKQQKKALSSELDREVKDIQTREKKEKDKENPYKLMEEEHQKKIETHKAKLDQAEDSIIQHRTKLGHLVHWEGAFGNRGIRSQLFDRVIGLLDQKVHKYMTALSEGAVQVSFDTEEELKSGKTRDRFVILVSDDTGTRPYESYSGGEKKRVKLAVDLALSDIVCEEREKTLDFVIFDEVLSYLDDDGRLRAMDLWREQIASEAKKFIMVVEHSPDIKTMFDKEIKVIKENGSSKLIFDE